MALVALIILGLASPFVAMMFVGSRIAGRRWPAWWTCAAPVAFAVVLPVGVWALSDLLGGRTYFTVGAAVVIASPVAAPAVWKLTRRWWVAGLVPVAACAAGVWFWWFEKRTHGPWYIRSEGLAILLSIATSAALWHLWIGGALWVWAVKIGRRSAREHSGCCTACGYSLAGLAGDRCPECGRRVGDPPVRTASSGPHR